MSRVQWSGVFDVEDRLARGEESVVCAAFAELGALLVNSEVHDGRESGEDVEAVLEADAEIVG